MERQPTKDKKDDKHQVTNFDEKCRKFLGIESLSRLDGIAIHLSFPSAPSHDALNRPGQDEVWEAVSPMKQVKPWEDERGDDEWHGNLLKIIPSRVGGFDGVETWGGEWRSRFQRCEMETEEILGWRSWTSWRLRKTRRESAHVLMISRKSFLEFAKCSVSSFRCLQAHWLHQTRRIKTFPWHHHAKSFTGSVPS